MATAKTLRPALPDAEDKTDDLQYDLGNLTGFDTHPIDPQALKKEGKEVFLRKHARDNAQLLFNQIFALDGSGELVNAELTHTGTINFTARGDANKVVELSRTFEGPSFGFPGVLQTKWDIGLSPELPIDLFVDVGSGPVQLELDRLDLSDFTLSGGSGPVQLDLPASQERYQAEIDGGSGPIKLDLSDRAELELVVDVGSGPFTATLGRDLDLDLSLSGGSGPIRIDLPGGAEVKVEAWDDGSGPLTVGGGLQRVSGDDDTGVWQTSGFDQAERQILITVRSAGSGPITIR